jgi:uncharacterized membrane protein
MFAKIKKHRNLIAIFLLLAAASIISLLLASVRINRSDTTNYKFLFVNLGLAWIPFLFAGLAYGLANIRKRILYVLVFVAVLVWLIFFPNAPYILTDFEHLSYTSDGIPVWYDVILLVWSAFTGLMLGVVSLYLIQEIIRRILGSPISWGFVIVVSIAESFGVYIGRFMRWNSWDIWHHPIALVLDIFDQLRHPLANKDTYIFTAIFSALFLFIYTTITLVGRLMNERR